MSFDATRHDIRSRLAHYTSQSKAADAEKIKQREASVATKTEELDDRRSHTTQVLNEPGDLKQAKANAAENIKQLDHTNAAASKNLARYKCVFLKRPSRPLEVWRVRKLSGQPKHPKIADTEEAKQLNDSKEAFKKLSEETIKQLNEGGFKEAPRREDQGL